MNKITLERLTLKNFKGIEAFDLDLRGGKSASIYGDNGVGKTTLKNAYLWCLTGRDSDNRTDHEIRPYDKDNNIIHNLNSVVEMNIAHGGKNTTLKRLYKERWSRKTGDVDKTYDGNTTDLFINDVKVKKSEYEREVAEMFNLDLIQLLSDPAHFVNLKWQEQRDYLFSLIDITDADIAAKNSELEGFWERYNTSMLDAEKKHLNSKRREIEQDIVSNDAKLEENLNNLGEPRDWSKLEDSLSLKKEELKKIEAKITDKTKAIAEANKQANEAYLSAYSELNSQLVEAEKALENAIAESKSEHNAGLVKLKNELGDLLAKKKNIEIANKNIEEANARNNRELARLADERARYLQEYREINSREFSVDSICPTCGAIRGDIDSFRAEAEKAFNNRKAADLERNMANGKAVAAKIEELSMATKSIASSSEIDQKIKDLREIIDAYPKYKVNESDFEELYSNIYYLKSQINNINKPELTSDEVDSTLKETREVLSQEIKELEEKLYDKKVFDEKSKRIEELREAIKASSIAQAKLDKEVYLINLFEKTKNELCESLINAKFKVVKFSLFEYLVDGTPKPNCKALFNGVPLSTLNTGAIINVGLDIIRTFSAHFNECYPVFIDNKESVTKLIDIDSQVITLSVKEGQKELLVETK